jgi:hypothetical protein
MSTITTTWTTRPSPARFHLGIGELRSVGQLRDALLAAFDPELETERFFRSILSAGRARQHALAGTGESAMLVFALDVLLPIRERGTERFLRRDAIDRKAFEEFIDVSERVAHRAIDTATTQDELADAMVSVLDNVHSYLLAHDLVSADYKKIERVLAHHLRPEPVTESEYEKPEPSLTNGHRDASHLALAA